MSFITLMETSLFMPKDIIFLIIIVGGTLVIYGKNPIIGIISTFITSAGMFVLYYIMGWNYVTALKIVMVMLAVMAIMILLVKKQSDSGVGVY